MNRKYLSGAKKRKLKAVKDKKEDTALKNVPKINALFGTSTSTPAPDSSENVSVEKNINEETDSSTDEENVDESMEIGHEAMGIETEPLEFSTDAALWDVSTNIRTLQNYWISKGENVCNECEVMIKRHEFYSIELIIKFIYQQISHCFIVGGILWIQTNIFIYSFILF